MLKAGVLSPNWKSNMEANKENTQNEETDK